MKLSLPPFEDELEDDDELRDDELELELELDDEEELMEELEDDELDELELDDDELDELESDELDELEEELEDELELEELEENELEELDDELELDDDDEELDEKELDEELEDEDELDDEDELEEELELDDELDDEELELDEELLELEDDDEELAAHRSKRAAQSGSTTDTGASLMIFGPSQSPILRPHFLEERLDLALVVAEVGGPDPVLREVLALEVFLKKEYPLRPEHRERHVERPRDDAHERARVPDEPLERAELRPAPAHGRVDEGKLRIDRVVEDVLKVALDRHVAGLEDVVPHPLGRRRVGVARVGEAGDLKMHRHKRGRVRGDAAVAGHRRDPELVKTAPLGFRVLGLPLVHREGDLRDELEGELRRALVDVHFVAGELERLRHEVAVGEAERHAEPEVDRRVRAPERVERREEHDEIADAVPKDEKDAPRVDRGDPLVQFHAVLVRLRDRGAHPSHSGSVGCALTV